MFLIMPSAASSSRGRAGTVQSGNGRMTATAKLPSPSLSSEWGCNQTVRSPPSPSVWVWPLRSTCLIPSGTLALGSPHSPTLKVCRHPCCSSMVSQAEFHHLMSFSLSLLRPAPACVSNVEHVGGFPCRVRIGVLDLRGHVATVPGAPSLLARVIPPQDRKNTLEGVCFAFDFTVEPVCVRNYHAK